LQAWSIVSVVDRSADRNNQQPPHSAKVVDRSAIEPKDSPPTPTDGAVGDQGGRSLRRSNQQQPPHSDQGGRSLRDRNKQQHRHS